MGCGSSTETGNTQSTVSNNNTGYTTAVDNNDSSLENRNQASSQKARDGFTAAQSAWQTEALNSHNSFRALHGVPPLALDDAINRKAQGYAEYLVKNNLFEHSKDRDGLGENLYSMNGSESVMNDSLGTEATKTWYDELENYDFNNPGFSMGTGHFTQVVWKSTRKMGLGVAFSNDGRNVIVVGRYGPPGNVTGQFPENVPPPL